MERIKVKLVRSKIGSTKRQKKTVEALGLNKINSERIHQATPNILGMIEKVKHLIEVEQVND